MTFLPYRSNRVDTMASIVVLRPGQVGALWSAFFNPAEPVPEIPAEVLPPYTVEIVWSEPSPREERIRK